MRPGSTTRATSGDVKEIFLQSEEAIHSGFARSLANHGADVYLFGVRKAAGGIGQRRSPPQNRFAIKIQPAGPSVS